MTSRGQPRAASPCRVHPHPSLFPVALGTESDWQGETADLLCARTW